MTTATPIKEEVDSAVAEFPYRFEVVELADIYIDRFQRVLNENWIEKKLKKGFNPALFGTVAVSERPRTKGRGLYSAIDGQHRSELARRATIVEVPAIVYVDLTLEDEAILFSLFQRERRAITPYERFTADLVAKSGEAIALKALVESEQFVIAAQEAPLAIKGVVTVEKMYGEDPDRLRQTLRLVRQTWSGLPYATNERLLKGLYMWLADNPDVDEPRFVKKLGELTPSVISRRAEAFKETQGLTSTSPRFVAEVIDMQYRSRGGGRRG